VYVPMVVALMFALPIGASVLELLLTSHGTLNLGVFLRWFVFFPVGVRLTLAGVRQILQPRYTTETVLGIKAPEAQLVVRELGFANCGIGSIGLVSLAYAEWVYPAGLAGAVLYGLAGFNHLLHKGRGRNQSVAMVSDLLVAIILGVLLLPS
jgi:hypothetical protein